MGTSMGNMFSYAFDFNQDISNWNTAEVTSMKNMFSYAFDFNQNLDLNTANVIDMSKMFYRSENFNQDISNWNTAKVTSMIGMFYQATSFNQCLGEWGEQDGINDVAVGIMFQGSNCELTDTPGTDGSTEWCRDCSS